MDGAAEIWSEEAASITGLAVNRDGSHALVNLCSPGNQEIHLWELPGGLKEAAPHLKRRFRGHAQHKYVVRSCFGGHGDAFVGSGSEDHRVHIWHRETGAMLEQLTGHTAMVNMVAWSPTDPRVMASASDDQTVRIWVTGSMASRAE